LELSGKPAGKETELSRGGQEGSKKGERRTSVTILNRSQERRGSYSRKLTGQLQWFQKSGGEAPNIAH